MLFWNKICGLIAIFFISALSVRAQKAAITETAASKVVKNQSFSKSLNGLLNEQNSSLTQPLIIVPGNYYTQHFGIMCKKELALEKVTKIPFRFRLGSLQQCNYLEGKR